MATSRTTTLHSDNMSQTDNAPSRQQTSLALEIVAITRPMHAEINRLIVSRLPLALPPMASDTSPYISGLLHLLPVYMKFEELWLGIIDNTSPKEIAPGGDRRPKVTARVHEILRELCIPHLFRSDVIKADIRAMTGWSDETLTRQLNTIKGTGQLSAIISHIKQTVHAKPHTLIAYSYNLFMALFAGGRFIRGSFEKAGNEFWEAVPMPIRPTMQPCEPGSLRPQVPHSVPLQFWRFNTAEDGEDLKRDFKERLLKLEDKLSSEERDDILSESVIILKNIGRIVNQLDGIFYDGQGEKPSAQIPKRPSLAGRFVQTQFVARIRDSFMIAKERGVGTSFRSQSLDTTATEEEGPESESTDSDDIAGDIELCPGVSKSMRFAKSLPVPSRRHGRAAKGHGMLSVQPPIQPANDSIPRPVLAGIIGLFLLYIFVRVRGIMGLGYTIMVQ